MTLKYRLTNVDRPEECRFEVTSHDTGWCYFMVRYADNGDSEFVHVLLAGDRFGTSKDYRLDVSNHLVEKSMALILDSIYWMARDISHIMLYPTPWDGKSPHSYLISVERDENNRYSYKVDDMTKRKASAERQIEQIAKLNRKIDESNWVFLNDDEKVNKTKLLEGEWRHRMAMFIEDPENGIGNDEYDVKFTMALLTRRYAGHLPKDTIVKFTNCLVDPAPKATTREQRLERVKRELKKF